MMLSKLVFSNWCWESLRAGVELFRVGLMLEGRVWGWDHADLVIERWISCGHQAHPICNLDDAAGWARKGQSLCRGLSGSNASKAEKYEKWVVRPLSTIFAFPPENLKNSKPITSSLLPTIFNLI